MTSCVRHYQRGAAIVEFAIVVPMLVLLLIGIIETGRYLAFGVRLSNAAHAGAQFAAQNIANAKSAPDVANAACSDSSFTCTTSTPAPGHTASPDTMYVSSALSCNSKTSPCPIGQRVIQVNTSGTFRPLLYPMFGNSVPMSAQAIQQVPE